MCTDTVVIFMLKCAPQADETTDNKQEGVLYKAYLVINTKSSFLMGWGGEGAILLDNRIVLEIYFISLILSEKKQSLKIAFFISITTFYRHVLQS